MEQSLHQARVVKEQKKAPYYKIDISLYVPIKIHKKRESVKTGVHVGKIVKEMIYDLILFISRGFDKNSLDEESEVADEDFIEDFTLSRFRKDLMGLARDEFAEEYSVAKKSLGRKVKLSIQ